MIRGGGYAFRDKKGILRLISMILWPIKIVSILAAAGILLSVTFSLGMFHAAGSLFFPMFDLGDLHQSLILSLPGIVTCLVFVLTGVMILPSDRKRDPDVMRHHGIWQNWVSSAVVVVAGIAFSAVLGDVLGAGFVGALLLTLATALIASRLRKKFAAAGSGGLAPLARLVVVIVPVMFMFLVGVFWLGYVQVESKIDQFETSRTYLNVNGKLTKIAVLVPGKSRTLFYDGAAVRMGSENFLNSVVVNTPRHRSSLICALVAHLNVRKPPEVCG